MISFLLKNQKRAFIVGLTGGIASGKSEVEKIWNNFNIPIFDLDKVVGKLLSPGLELQERLLELVGPSYLLEDGHWNRPLLRQIVFRNKEIREKLESYSTPLVIEELKNQISNLSSPYVVISSALMVNAKTGLRWPWVDWLVFVDVPEQLQIKRLMERDNCSLEEAHLALSIQSTRLQKQQQSNWILENKGSKMDLETKIHQLNNYLQNKLK